MSYLKNILQKLFTVFIVVLFIYIAYLNYRLYYSPTFVTENGIELNQDVYRQLTYLKDYLKNKDGGRAAQAKYPEGFVFVNALYGLTWCEFIAPMPRNHPIRKEGLSEIDWTLDELRSDYAKMWFPNKLVPEEGIFYAGWSNYLLAKKLELQSPSERNAADTFLFRKQCEEIFQAFDKSSSVYLESYINAVWPADNLVAIASLGLFDKINPPQYQMFIKNWLAQVKTTLDAKTGLIPHEVVYQTDGVKEGAKGSSQSLMLNFLIDLDSVFAQQQFALYQEQYLDYRFGLPGIREYPKGSSGGQDVDSGPVILEIGGAASLVGQRTMAIYGNIETSVGLRNSIEGFGMAYTSNNQKKYVLGLEPIADAFITWANVVDIQNKEKQNTNWRWAFQSLSLALFIIFFLVRKAKERFKPKNKA